MSSEKRHLSDALFTAIRSRNRAAAQIAMRKIEGYAVERLASDLERPATKDPAVNPDDLVEQPERWDQCE